MKPAAIVPAMRLFLLSLLASIFLVRSSTGATPDETARFLAGLPMHGSSLEVLAQQPLWVEHAMVSDDAWRPLETSQLNRIREWAGNFLEPEHSSKTPLVYFFSGPDFLYPHALFPRASDYVLCGLEPAGALPDLDRLPRAALGPALMNLRKAMNSALSFSFFITKEMKTDLTQTQLSGTVPVLLVFLARGGCQVESVEPLALDKTGAPSSGKGATNGVRIVFFGPDGEKQNLYYFTADLSDGALQANPAILKFTETLGRSHGLLKAASYLLHSGGFDSARNFLLTQSDLLLQDDSGIPVRFFAPARWQLRFFGRYPGPIDIFRQHYQPTLAELYRKSTPPPLEFSFGYRWQPNQSGLLVARAQPR